MHVHGDVHSGITQGMGKEMGFDSGAYPGNSGQRPQQPPPPYSGQWPPPPQQPLPQQYQPGWQPPQPPPGAWRAPGRPPRRRKSGAGWIFGSLCLLAVIIVIAIVAAHGRTPQPSASSPPATGAPAATQAAAPAAGTVTFIVTGSAAQVTYGDGSSSEQGTVPMRQTARLGNPLYYSIEAQLQGGGEVTCKIEVNGHVISQANATGGYNIAMCEISRDPLTGQWSDTNTGG